LRGFGENGGGGGGPLAKKLGKAKKRFRCPYSKQHGVCVQNLSLSPKAERERKAKQQVPRSHRHRH